jgi:hypothetical protein
VYFEAHLPALPVAAQANAMENVLFFTHCRQSIKAGAKSIDQSFRAR